MPPLTSNKSLKFQFLSALISELRNFSFSKAKIFNFGLGGHFQYFWVSIKEIHTIKGTTSIICKSHSHKYLATYKTSCGSKTHVAVFLLFFHFLVLDLGRAARPVLFALSGRNRVALQQTHPT